MRGGEDAPPAPRLLIFRNRMNMPNLQDVKFLFRYREIAGWYGAFANSDAVGRTVAQCRIRRLRALDG
jgi:hypothetical protein